MDYKNSENEKISYIVIKTTLGKVLHQARSGMFHTLCGVNLNTVTTYYKVSNDLSLVNCGKCKKRLLTYEEDIHKQKQLRERNRKVAHLTETIEALEEALNDLYKRRAGMIVVDIDGKPNYMYCRRCGIETTGKLTKAICYECLNFTPRKNLF